MATLLLGFLPGKLDEIAMQAARARAQAVGDFVAPSVAPGLVFEDSAALTSALSPLSQTEDALYGLALTAEHELLARIPEEGALPVIPDDLQENQMRLWLDEAGLHINRPVEGRDGVVGRIQLGFSLEWVEEAQAQSWELSLTFTAVLALGLYAALLFLGYFWTRPILSLTGLSQAVARGELEAIEIAPAPEDSSSRDELKRLEFAFHFMLLKLRESSTALREQIVESDAQRKTAVEALEDLRRTQEQLVHSEKLASLGQLVAGIAHELNTPLAAIHASATQLNGKLRTSFEQALIPLGELTVEQRDRVYRFLELSVQGPQLQGLQARRQRKQLAKHLRGLDVSDAQERATQLLELGWVPDSPLWAEMIQGDDLSPVLDCAVPLAAMLRSGDNIETASMKAKKIVTALKTFSRVGEQGERTLFCLRDNLQTVLTLYQSHLRAGVELELRVPEELMVWGDSDSLAQVWTNLIHNAIQAMREEGQLRISGAQRGELLVIEIANNGPPIPEAILPRIFEPFFTTKTSGEGTGLGLDIVRQIVLDHGGSTEVESDEDWTVFRVMLPEPAAQD